MMGLWKYYYKDTNSVNLICLYMTRLKMNVIHFLFIL